MRQIDHTFQALRASVMLVLAVLMLATPFSGLAQDAAPADPTPAPGSLKVTLAGTTGIALSGTFAVTDSAGGYQQFAVGAGFGSAANLAAGPATVVQVSGTTDYALDGAARYVEVPSGGVASVSFTNAFLDADGDGIGDSLDACPGGNDLVDSDGDGTADACDATPSGDPTPVPTVITIAEPAMVPTEVPTLPATPEQEVAMLSLEIADEPVIVEDAPVSCQDAAATNPWIISDLDDYPPGGLVTLTGGDWAPGQTVEILVEDDGIADAEMGEWSHFATVVADENGNLVYVFTIAPWFVADYTVVATGECAKAETAFTDSVQGGGCTQVTASDVVAPGSYIMFKCTSSTNPIRIGVISITTGWQWSYLFSNDPNLAPPAYSSLNWSTSGTASDQSPASGAINTAYFFISPLSTALPGSTGTASIQIKDPNGISVQYTSNITAYRAIQASDVTMTCTPASQTIGVTASGTVTCTVSAPSVAAEARITATVSMQNRAEWNRTSAVRVRTGVVTKTAPLVIDFTLAPTCSALTSAQAMAITSSLVLSNTNLFNAPSITGPSTSVSAARTSGTVLSTSLTSASLDWTRPYAFTSSTNNPGSLSYAVNAVGCSGWTVQVGASPFVSAQGRTIGASNLALTSSTIPSGTVYSRPVASGPLGTTQTVLAASATDSTANVTQTLNVNMTIPGGSLVGTYQSTITITAASGP